MEEAFTYVYDLLKDSSAITAEVSADNIFPLLAPLDTAGDFITYNTVWLNRESKDLLVDFRVEINCFMASVKEAAQMIDTIHTEVTNDTKLRFRTAEVLYSEDRNQAYGQLILTLKN